MIRATAISLRRGTKLLLEHADFVVHPGERIGLIGQNGAGKTTLFALLQGKLDADSGTLHLPQDWRISSVAQQIHATDQAACEFVIDGDTHLRILQQQRAHTTDGPRIAELETALLDAGAWSARARAEQLLAYLGFTPAQWAAPVNSFSGGWQMRLALARALMAPSDLLLLDEPTNHLDLDAMLWLERWLASYAGTVLVISHDTEFLNAVSTAILHIEHQQITRYRGNYDSFCGQRAERLRQQQAAWDKQSQQAAHLQAFIDRFRAKATKAKQAQSRIKALARMQTLAPLHQRAGLDIVLPEPASMPDPLLRLDAASLGYADEDETVSLRIVLPDVTLTLRANSRIGVLGVNGAGKSTLIKTLAGQLPVLGGGRIAARGLQIGYFAQHQLDQLDPHATALAHMQRLAPQAREQDLRSYLGRFGFAGEQALAKVAPFSGGEKARLALAILVWQRPNLLLLDEPSNHLDVDTRQALARALAQYEGSVLLVSHDRHLLRTTVDQFWIVADGQVHEFDGDLDDYRDWLQARGRLASADNGADTTPPANRKNQRREQALLRQQLARQRKPLTDELVRVEADMQRVQERLAELVACMGEADFYSDARRLERPTVLMEHGELDKRQHALEERWLALQEKLEALAQPEFVS